MSHRCPADPGASRPRTAHVNAVSAPAAAVTALAFVLTGCDVRFGQVRGATSQSHLEFRLWFWMMVAGIAVAVLVWALIFWAIFRYRRRDDRMPKQFQEHIGLEVTYTIIPLIMVLIIFGFTFVVENNIDDVLTPPQVVVNVTGYQWGWIFQYSKPGLGSTVNCTTSPQDCVTVETPANAARQLSPSRTPRRSTPSSCCPWVRPSGSSSARTTSSTASTSMRSTSAGTPSPASRTVRVHADHDRRLTRASAPQYCGLYHSEMLFSVKVVTPAQFQQWF